MDEERLRLIKLVEHWIKHNEEHGTRFREEADVAEKKGLKDVVLEIRRAAHASKEVSNNLSKALSLLKNTITNV